MAWHYPLIDRIVAGREPWLTAHPSIGRALSTAWLSADAAGRRRLVEALLKHGGADGGVALIHRYHELDAGSQQELAQQLPQLHGPLRKILRDAQSPAQPAVNALQLIETAALCDAPPPPTSPPASPPIAHPHADASDAARGASPSAWPQPEALANAATVARPAPPADAPPAPDRLTPTSLIEAAQLSYLVTARLRHESAEVRAAAGRCLACLVAQRPRMDGRSAHRLAQVIGEAVAHFPHHRHPASLRGWLSLGGQSLALGGPAVEALQDADHPAVLAMREQLQAADDIAVRRGLIPALALPTLALAAVQGLRRCAADDTLLEAIIGQEHLLRLPAVTRGLARAGDAAELLPAAWKQDDPDRPWRDVGGGPSWVAWVAALPLPAVARVVRLSRLAESADPQTRLAALREAIAICDPDPATRDPQVAHEAQAIARRLARDDEHPAVARLASTWLTAQKVPGEILGDLMRSPHEAVRDAAGRRLGAGAFDRLWQNWPKLNASARASAARAAARLDPSTRHRLDELLMRSGPQRDRALEVAELIAHHHPGEAA